MSISAIHRTAADLAGGDWGNRRVAPLAGAVDSVAARFGGRGSMAGNQYLSLGGRRDLRDLFRVHADFVPRGRACLPTSVMSYDDNTEFSCRPGVRRGLRNRLALAFSVLSVAYGVAIILSPIIACLALYKSRK